MWFLPFTFKTILWQFHTSQHIDLAAAVIEGGKTENLSAKDLAGLGFCAVAYPWTLVAAKLKSIRETLEELKGSMTVGAPPMILSYSEVCEGVGFNKYWVSGLALRIRPSYLQSIRILKTDISLLNRRGEC